MTVDLTLHGRPIGTVFDLLGKKENDITYSVGYAMAQSAGLAEAFVAGVIADQVTGLPLVWTVHDASMDEARAIVPLLSFLFSLWPECPAKTIAGDSAWDENEWCRLCEVDYGIHPIFCRHPKISPPPVGDFSRDGTCPRSRPRAG
jgi:hypothetical protein